MKEAGIGAAAAVTVFLAVSGYDITPILLVAGLAVVYFLVRGTTGLGRRFETVGKAGRRANVAVTFNDVGGLEVAKRELVEALDFVKDREVVTRLGIRPLRGILLTGLPGTGKTLLARAAATYTGSAFIAASGSEFIEVYAGVGAQRVRRLFGDARGLARREGRGGAIVFIDELEVVGGQRGRHESHLEYDQTLNQLLVEMDGIQPDADARILVIGATNRPDLLDSALLRPGRFDRVVRVDLPDREARLCILKIHTRTKPLAPDVNLDDLSRETFGFSGAHLESVCNEAAICAMRQGRSEITNPDFAEAVEKVMMGEKLQRRPSEEELRRIACHEAGHAIISEEVRPGAVSSVCISSRGSALGYVRQVPRNDAYLATRDELVAQLDICLGGTVAEEVLYGETSTGCLSDLRQAVDLGKQMVECGMSPLGVVSPADIPQAVLHDTVTKMLADRRAAVRARIERRRSALRRVQQVLLGRESLSGEELRAVLKESA